MLSGAVMLLCWCWLYRINGKSVETSQPQAPEPPKIVNDEPRTPHVPTPEEKERWIYLRKLHIPLPGSTFYTIGMASKLCDWVVVGTVEKVGYVGPRRGKLVDDKYASEFFGDWVVFSVDLCLYGKSPKEKKMTFIIPDKDWVFHPDQTGGRKPKPDDRMLAFLTNKRYDLAPLFMGSQPTENLRFLDFDKAKAKRTKINELYAWSYMTLDDKETETEAVRAAKVYLDFFTGKGKRDRESYHDLLCLLSQSPVQRIRDDAERDFMAFYAREARADQHKILDDDRVRKEMKDYYRFLLRNEKPEEEKEK